MLRSRARWIDIEDNDERIYQPIHPSPIVDKLLKQRGITTKKSAENFLTPDLKQLHNPAHLSMIERTKQRIHQAIQNDEKILIYGDYDADGITATVLMLKTLEQLGGRVDYYIPHRIEDGYGLHKELLNDFVEDGYKVIITVDTGIANVEEAVICKHLGIDLIITDHHEPQERLPEAYAIIHPHCSPNYPFKDLAGVGVAFKLATYLLKDVPESFLELVAIGTIADMVPLVDENRILVYYGLKQVGMNNLGIKTLMKQCLLDGPVTEEDIGFILAPRLNAVGRLTSADLAIQLLMTDDEQMALQIAKDIEHINHERRQLVDNTMQEALSMLKSSEDQSLILVAKEGWHEGVLGIVASRLVNQFHKPAIVLSIDGASGVAKGSARSIPALNLFEACMSMKTYFLNFGGHAQAAGMTLAIDQVDVLKEQLNQYIGDRLTAEDFKPTIEISGDVRLEDIDRSFIYELDQFAPYGIGNPKPIFHVQGIPNDIRLIGQQKKHLKLTFHDHGKTVESIGFGMGDLFPHVTGQTELSLVGELQMNVWNGIETPQILLKDLKIDERQVFDHRGKQRLDLTPYLSKDERQLALYDESIQDRQHPLPDSIHSVHYAEAITMNQTVDTLFLYDLPPSLEDLSSILKLLDPINIHVCFYVHESLYLDTFPNRADFKWLYGFIHSHKRLNYHKAIKHIQQGIGWSKENITFMVDVFLELQFVKIEDEHIILNPKPEKRELHTSQVYKKRLQRIEMEKRLYYSSYKQLKDYVAQLLKLDDVAKEETVYGL